MRCLRESLPLGRAVKFRLVRIKCTRCLIEIIGSASWISNLMFDFFVLHYLSEH